MGFWKLSDLEGGGGGIDPNTPISDLPGTLQASRISGYKRAAAMVPRTTSYPLNNASTEMSVFRKKMYIPENGLVLLTWQVDTTHNGISSSDPILVSGKACYRFAATEAGLTGAFLDIEASRADGMIRDLSHHYYTVEAARAPFAVVGGRWYEFSLKLSGAATQGSTVGQNGVATMKNNGGQQYLLVEYEPGAVLEP
jgi:hypothetical protein